MEIKRPKPPSLKTYKTEYKDFTGACFVRDPFLCPPNKSPEIVNMINENGVIVGRKGFRVVHKLEGNINCLEYGYINQKALYFCHAGTKLYVFDDDTITEIYDGLPDRKSVIFFDLWAESFLIAPDDPVPPRTLGFILTGEGYFYIDVKKDEAKSVDTYVVDKVEAIAKIPVVTIAGKSTGGGEVLEGVNLLQPKRTEKKYGDGTAKTFQLSTKPLDETTVDVVRITDGDPVYYTENASGSSGFTVNRETGVVTFNTAPPESPVEGEDNVFITYAKTVEGYAAKINKCQTFTQFGVGGAQRIFVTRNEEFRNYDWWCEVQDPSYFPDTNYGIAGSENTAILGYLKFYSSLAIVKEDNSQDSTIYFRTGEVTEGKVVFFTQPGIVSTGAVSPHSFYNLRDEPLFLSKSGIFAIISNAVNQQAVLQNRSYWIDDQLKKEKYLKEAVATEWNGYYLLSVKSDEFREKEVTDDEGNITVSMVPEVGRTYLLDGRVTEVTDVQKQYPHPAYYWIGYNPTCYLSIGDSLWFGTADGELCKFRDSGTTKDYQDGGTLEEAGQPIFYLFTTKQDGDDSSYLKSTTKKGCSVVLKPFLRSYVNLYYNTNLGLRNPTKPEFKTASIFDFDDIDFAFIDFNSTTFAQPFWMKKRIKKYGTLQYIFTVEDLERTFGIVSITKMYVITNKQARG